MDPKVFKKKEGPEFKLRKDLIELLRRRKWYVHIMHGSAYSSGLPDLYCAHQNHGIRWIEVKNADSYHFTRDQLTEFPLMMAAGVGIWVVALPVGFTEAQLEYEYKNVVIEGPPNWTKYLGHSRRPY